MQIKPVILGTIAYTAVTFPLAVLWHVVLFKPTYVALGYFGGEPSFVLGFSAIFIQGAMLSAGFGFFNIGGRPLGRGLTYALVVGLFFWTSHVLAFAAKNALSATPLFFILETLYLCLQFGIFGALIGVIYDKQAPSAAVNT